MEDLLDWMDDFTARIIESNVSLLDIVNQESPYKVHDLSELKKEAA